MGLGCEVTELWSDLLPIEAKTNWWDTDFSDRFMGDWWYVFVLTHCVASRGDFVPIGWSLTPSLCCVHDSGVLKSEHAHSNLKTWLSLTHRVPTLICVGKHDICVGNREIILIGNREIKRPRICHNFKTANFNSRKFKWGYSIIINHGGISCLDAEIGDILARKWRSKGSSQARKWVSKPTSILHLP